MNVASITEHMSRAPLHRLLGEQVRADRLEQRPPQVEEIPNNIRVGIVLPDYVDGAEGFPQRELIEKPLTRRIVSTPEKVAAAIVARRPGRQGRALRAAAVLDHRGAADPRARPHAPQLSERPGAHHQGRRGDLARAAPGLRRRRASARIARLIVLAIRVLPRVFRWIESYVIPLRFPARVQFARTTRAAAGRAGAAVRSRTGSTTSSSRAPRSRDEDTVRRVGWRSVTQTNWRAPLRRSTLSSHAASRSQRRAQESYRRRWRWKSEL